ncbi:MAG: peptide MFS transporter, partial [Alphaproteobacteria bacterium]
GSKKSVKFGAVLMALGYFGLTFGGEQADAYLEYDGTRYSVEQVQLEGDEVDQYVISGTARYLIVGNPDSSVTLVGADGTDLPGTLEPGTYDFDGERSDWFIHIMFISLSLVVIGNGYFKPNISTIVGTLYATGDSRRDAGFTIFYMGINMGSLLSQILTPWIAEAYGWAWAFGLVVVGMLASWALIQFENGRLKGHGEPPKDAPGGMVNIGIYAASFASVFVMWFLMIGAMEAASATQEMQSTGLVDYFLSLSLLGKVMVIVYGASIFGIPIYSAIALTPVERDMMISAVILIFFSTIFWTLFEQAGSSMTLFAEHNTDRSIPIFGSMSAGQVQLFNPLFIVVLAPIFSIMWTWLARKGWEPSIPVKFALALVQVGLGFVVLAYGANYIDDTFRVGLIWLVLAYLLHSTGELCLSPVGLSMITKLSVAKLVGLMMGAWFLSSAMAQYAGGIIAQLAASETVGTQILNREASLNTSIDVFYTIGLWAFGIGIFLFITSPLMRKMTHGVK